MIGGGAQVIGELAGGLSQGLGGEIVAGHDLAGVTGRQRRLRPCHDPLHRLHSPYWIPAGGSLPREHHGIRAIEHGIRHIGGLSPCGPGIADHRIQHLRGRDHRLDRRDYRGE